MGKGKGPKVNKMSGDVFQRLSEDFSEQMKVFSSTPDQDVQAYLMKQKLDITLGKVPAPVSYDDGDQSPLYGGKAQWLRSCWCTGMDNNPPFPYPYISEFAKIIYCGGYKSFLQQLDGKSGSEIERMLAKRESLLHITPIFQVIMGARAQVVTVNKDGSEDRNETDYIKILLKLLSLGADVNVHDVAGYTPLHHCLTAFGNDLTLKMAEKLVRAGAKVDARNRFGCTPLMDAGLANRYDFMEFLLQHGADQTLMDNDGCSTKLLASHNPREQKLLAKYANRRVREEREERGLNPTCRKCSFDEGLKKCTGCYHVWYCSAKCQREDWESHKEECQKTSKEYKLCTYNKELVTLSFVSVKVSLLK